MIPMYKKGRPTALLPDKEALLVANFESGSWRNIFDWRAVRKDISFYRFYTLFSSDGHGTSIIYEIYNKSFIATNCYGVFCSAKL